MNISIEVSSDNSLLLFTTVLGKFISDLETNIGETIINITSTTNITSTIGVMCMSSYNLCVRSLLYVLYICFMECFLLTLKIQPRYIQ